ncbi:MAG: hypothetical protein J0651_00895, partial [Actinobacteria bacterium]|nr:hypothetical protein [Actinomycetota bacterium]
MAHVYKNKYNDLMNHKKLSVDELQIGGTRCLLARLQELNAEGPESQTAFSDLWRSLGYTNKKPPIEEKIPDKSKFINLMTVEEMAEIEDTKTKITACLKELEAMQAEAFAKQKEITKRCYDVYSKYRGLVDVRAVREMWFGMNVIRRGERYGYELNTEDTRKFAEREQYIPKEWMERCTVKGQTKDGWDDYVDGEWDAAYDHAFGVTAFRAFIKTEIPRMMNLDLHSSKALDVDHTWYDLYDETGYFQKKTTMHHISMSGNSWPFVQDSPENQCIALAWNYPTNVKLEGGYYGMADVDSLKIVDAF